MFQDELETNKVNEGDWVIVVYEGERFIGKVMTEAVNEDVCVRCLEKPFGINEPQKLEREEDAIFYGRLFRTNVTPQLIKFGRKWLWRY